MTTSDTGTYPYFTQLPNQRDSIYTYEPKNTEFLQNLIPVNYNDDITSIPNFLHKCKRCIEVLHGKLIMGTMFPSDRENAIGNSAVNELLILDHKSLPLI